MTGLTLALLSAINLIGIWKSAGSDTPQAQTVTTMHGMSIQPGSPIDSNAYATPIGFPLYVPRYTLFVTFMRHPDGAIGGYIRDPIGNFGTMAPFETVSVNANTIDITSRAHHFTGAFTTDADTIALKIGTGPPMVFHRVSGAGAVGFFPRTNAPNEPVEIPATLDDGWASATLEDERIARRPLTALVDELARTAPTSPRSPFIQAVLVARDDRLVLDQYFYGFDAATPHDVRSAGKSLDAALFGIAMQTDPQLSVSAPAYRWLPYQHYENGDAAKRRITIADLFDMSSGLACDDNDDDSPGNEDTMQSQTAQPDWYKYMMDLPIVNEPGSKAVYCSGGLNVLGGIIAYATNEWTPQLFNERFAAPLHFGVYHLQLTPGKQMYMGGGSYFLPRDFLKLGQLFLQDGNWNGKQLFSPQWAREAVSPHSALTAPGDYGYSWHITTYSANGHDYSAYEAVGNGGQYLTVVPALHMVVEVLSANYGDYFTWRTFHDSVIKKIVAAAAS